MSFYVYIGTFDCNTKEFESFSDCYDYMFFEAQKLGRAVTFTVQDDLINPDFKDYPFEFSPNI